VVQDTDEEELQKEKLELREVKLQKEKLELREVKLQKDILDVKKLQEKRKESEYDPDD